MAQVAGVAHSWVVVVVQKALAETQEGLLPGLGWAVQSVSLDG